VETPSLELCRWLLKDELRKRVDFSQTDQARGVAPPPIETPCDAAAERIDLPRPPWNGVQPIELREAIGRRESRRQFLPEALSLEELAFLLWATQGVRQVLDEATALRTVPSAGSRHALETYLCVSRVDSLTAEAVYRYLPIEHQLVHAFDQPHLPRRLVRATLGQAFVGRAAVVFVWTAVPYRMEWRYGLASHKVIALDAGHVCQNLYLACESIGAGTCAVAAYDQAGMDELLHVDGQDEFVTYLAPVGRVVSSWPSRRR